jgi:2'-5' RNA ligase
MISTESSLLSRPMLSSVDLSVFGSRQLWLTDICPAGPPTDGLFLAAFPPPSVTDTVARLAQQLRVRHGLQGRPLATDRFHVTLHHFGNYHGLRRDFVEMAVEAAAKITAPPFEVTFDRVMSFRRNLFDQPVVLRGDSSLITLKKFQQDLGSALTKAGLGRKITKRFTPHVTLLYDQQVIAEQVAVPITWTVNEFVHVHSLLGRTQHISLGRWPLRG